MISPCQYLLEQGFHGFPAGLLGGYRNGLNLRAVADQVPGPVVVVGTEGNVGTWPVPRNFAACFTKGNSQEPMGTPWILVVSTNPSEK